MKKIHSAFITVYPQDVDCNKQVRLTVLGSHILNTSGLAASEGNFGVETLYLRGLAWVVSRLAIEMDHFPSEYEEIRIDTWVEEVGKLVSVRSFSIHNKAGEKIGAACALWAIIDLKSRRPVNIENVIDLYPFVHEQKTGIAKPARIDDIHDEPLEIREVRYSDIDLNQHANSMKYVEWLLDTLPNRHYVENRIARFEVNYTHEARDGEKVGLSRRDSDGYSVFEARSCDLRTLCRIKITWRPVLA